MKKYLPFILLVFGILVIIVAIFLIKGKKEAPVEETETVPQVAFELRPIASLTPSEDGHWLKLRIEKIKVNAATLDYELLYKLPDGRTQGVPGTINLTGQAEIERDLLLGSESSGKFRYDEGVKDGTLTLRFRNDKGKLSAKFSTDFALLAGTAELNSPDKKFTYKLDKIPLKTFFVVMGTFGAPDGYPSGMVDEPYGVFSMKETGLSGVTSLSSGSAYSYSDNQWIKLDSGKSQKIGIFVGVTE